MCNIGTEAYDPANGLSEVRLFEGVNPAAIGTNVITALLPAGGSCTDIPFQWTAPAVDVPHLTLVVDTNNVVAESNESNNYDRLKLPDPAIISVYIPGTPLFPDSPARSIPIGAGTIVIKNLGTMPIYQYNIHALLTRPAPVSTTVVFNPPTPPGSPLTDAGIFDILTNYTFDMVGMWTLEVWIDDNPATSGQVPEMDNVTNNYYRTFINVHEPYPDITFIRQLYEYQSVVINPEAPINQALHTVTAFQVTNRGELDVTNNFRIGLYEVYPDDTEVLVGSVTVAASAASPFRVGDVRDIVITNNYAPNTSLGMSVNGISRLKIVLDDTNLVNEGTWENNNTAARKFPDKQAIRVTVPYNSYVHDYSPARGIAVPVSAEVGTAGEMGVALHNIDWEVFEDMSGSWQLVFQGNAVNGGIGSDSSVLLGNYTFQTADPAYVWQNGKDFRVCFYIDRDTLPPPSALLITAPINNHIPERDENNNSACDVIHVHEALPDLTPWRNR